MRLRPFTFLVLFPLIAPAREPVNFSREIRPILSENCFTCHGPDEKKREAKLRLDEESSAKATRDGVTAVMPGNVEKSALIERIETKNADDVMPPLKMHKTISAPQLALLKDWIRQGAKWGKHWSYEVVVKPSVPGQPSVSAAAPSALVASSPTPIDAFLSSRLAKEHLAFSPEADRPTLIRRIALDLTGLPPTTAEVDAFASDRSPEAYPHMVDHFLAKPAYGEHWARIWLDLARYADSAGYPSDPGREIWAYRDWVIKALNDNMPFDQFTIEQMAGDLLPNPTDDQLIATAFHRNTMTQNEGGTNDEEFRNAAVIDRTNTTMAVWMGTSMACAQCHSHKYDPITNKEYFLFYAFLNQSEDSDKKDERPVHPFYTREQQQQRAEWQAEVAALDAKFATPARALLAGLDKWSGSIKKEPVWQAPKPLAVNARSGTVATIRDDASVLLPSTASTDRYQVEIPLSEDKLTALRLDAIPDQALPGGGSANGGNFVLSQVKAELVPQGGTTPLGRFVRVEMKGKGALLHLAEVQVFSLGENLALKGKAKQSSQYADAEAKRAIDGNTNGDYRQGSVSHTADGDTNPWWEVELPYAQPIEKIIVWNRTDGGTATRLKDWRVVLLDDQHNPVWSADEAAAPKASKEFVPSGITPLSFIGAIATFEQPGFPADAVLTTTPADDKGWAVAGGADKPQTLTLFTSRPVKVPSNSLLRVTLAQESKFGRHTLGSFKLSISSDPQAAKRKELPKAVLAALTTPSPSPTEQKTVTDYYVRNVATETAGERKQLATLRKQLADMKQVTVPVMKDLTGKDRRITRIQLRGNWQALDAEVTEGTPAALPPLPADVTPNRMALAKWLVDRQNPLTARVTVNRLWEHVFGVGIVRTSEEFGSQGDLPVHPELLDWLAADLMENHWDIKRTLRLMVTSQAYRQSSRVTPDLQERDPDNRLLARGPRFRPTGELLRDEALFVSGLLSPKMYGKPVRPMRPALGLNTAFGGGNDWTTSEGEDKHRRSVYTEVKRNSPYPSFSTFDAPNRETCTIRRGRTNTPLQAFVTLNDPVFIEAAQALARCIVSEGGQGTAERLEWAFRQCLSRPPNAIEARRLASL
ncbi:MAG: type protein, partial [Verrucomicrobiaceae bacterium]|nr:type protein [Verrucomicrobiaceae bacterium]